MAYEIITQTESERGCGYRKAGGLYLVSATGSRPCGKLPVALPALCPCCGAGIQFHRGFQWTDNRLLGQQECRTTYCATTHPGGGCFPFGHVKRFGLMWVGKEHYPSSVSFEAETERMGISKKIGLVPKDLTVGVDWVLLAHLNCQFIDEAGNIEFAPGIFSAFCPQRIEYVVKPTDPPSELQAMADRGITLVRVIRSDEGGQFELGVQGRPIPDDILQFAHDLGKLGNNQAKLGAAQGVTKQAISKRVNDYRRDYPALFPRHKGADPVP